MKDLVRSTPDYLEAKQFFPADGLEGQFPVVARKLHEFLGSGQEVSNWAKRRADESLAIEGQDFLIILSKSTGGRPSTEWYLTLDMAAHWAMLERNERGRAVRQWFIDKVKERQIQFPERVVRLIVREEIAEAIPLIADQVSGRLRPQVDRIDGNVVYLKPMIEKVHDAVSVMDNYKKSQRREPTDEQREIMCKVIQKHYAGFCPCCRRVILIDDNKISSIIRYDHWLERRWDRRLSNLWAICTSCNMEFEKDRNLRTEWRNRFDEFQRVMGIFIGSPYDQGLLFH